MKFALAWMTMFAFAVMVSCSISHRSGDYACTTQVDCTSPRVCSNGFCTVPDDVPIDAPGTTSDGSTTHVDAHVPTIDGPVNPTCPAICTTCDLGAHTCKIDCGNNGNCVNAVNCPPGFDCTINCSTPNSCRNGVTCTGDSACTVLCSGQSSCRNVTCGAGACDVECTGPNSCRGISCGASCGCDVTCGDSSLCQDITCTALQCDTGGGGCSSNNFNCNTCN